jgi:uncharacterized protein YjbI with pentapeptide repeats
VNANLEKADLTHAYLASVNLSFANLRGAKIYTDEPPWINMWGANLYQANLERATLEHVYLGGVNLQGANLSGAYLINAETQNVFVDTSTKADGIRLVRDEEIKNTNMIKIALQHIDEKLRNIILRDNANFRRLADS